MAAREIHLIRKNMGRNKSRNNSRNGTNHTRKIISILMAAVMVFTMAGCGNGDAGEGQNTGTVPADGDSAGTQSQGDDSAPADGQTAMGRYV